MTAPRLNDLASDPDLRVRATVHLMGGEAGRALAAAQGRALRDLLAVLADVEVGHEPDHARGQEE